MPIIEAIASGRAIVATGADGPVDSVDPRGGILVPPNNALALARDLTTILMTSGLAKTMGDYNRVAVEAFSWPTVFDRLEAVYDAFTRPSATSSARVNRPASQPPTPVRREN